MSDVVVRGGVVVLAERAERLDVVAHDGVVVALTPPGTVDTVGVEVVDADGLLVFPGAVDAHVHFDDPGRADWEGFDHGSAAAAAGGVTTVVDMPIDSDPPTVTADAVRAKAAAARERSRVDVALWAGLTPRSVGDLAAMVEAGAVGFKAFACPSGWDDFPPVDDASLAAGCAAAAAFDVPVAVHCEDRRLGSGPESEVASVRWAATIASAAGARLHVVHASACEAVDEARRWPGVTVETCPHYLVLTDGDVRAIGATARCAPPIRSAANREGLWARLRGGDIDWIASDHSPCPPALRRGAHPWAGISGVQLTLAVLLDAGLDRVRIAGLLTAAAAALRLPGKGPISVGNDADFALVDPDASWGVEAKDLFDRHRASPFIGRALRGRVVRTLVRGRTVYDIDTGVVDPGGGRVVRPA
ncbi:MAG: amidohydrolase family protein [Actinobacteria bacterium]|nr:amidohydrolase family protein [Actinomycetota bacterium]